MMITIAAIAPLVQAASLSAKAAEAIAIALPLLTRYEGLEDGQPATPALDPYVDPAGYITIGYGHLLSHPETHVPLVNSKHNRRLAFSMYPDGITEAEALALLVQDCIERYIQLAKDETYRDLEPYEQAAVLSWAFNFSPHRLFTEATFWQFIVNAEPLFDPVDPQILWEQTKAKMPFTQLDEAWVAWSRYTEALTGRVVCSPGLFARRLAEVYTFDGVPVEDAITGADDVVRVLKR